MQYRYFNLSKGEFRDILALLFNHDIKGLLSRGGFVIMRHNDIKGFEAHLSKKECSDGEIEPPRQPLKNEHLVKGFINTDSARLGIRARGFWRRGQNAFIDARVTNLGAAM